MTHGAAPYGCGRVSLIAFSVNACWVSKYEETYDDIRPHVCSNNSVHRTCGWLKPKRLRGKRVRDAIIKGVGTIRLIFFAYLLEGTSVFPVSGSSGPAAHLSLVASRY